MSIKDLPFVTVEQAVILRQAAIELEQRAEAAEEKLRELEMQEPIAWMYPTDLEKFQRTETYAQAFSVQVGCPGEDSVPLYAKPFPSKQEEK